MNEKKRKYPEENDDEDPSVDAIVHTKSIKPLPPNYVCKACGAVNEHAIYDCSLKKSKALEERAAKSAAHVAPSSISSSSSSSSSSKTVVMLSGLSFDTTIGKLITFLEEKSCDLNLVPQKQKGVNMLKFEDTQRSKGVAFIRYLDAASAQQCIDTLDGTKFAETSSALVLKAVLANSAHAPPPSSSLSSSSSSHHPHQNSSSSSSSSSSSRKKLPNGGGSGRCFRCGGAHDAQTCTAARICYRCKSDQHLSSNCPLKKTITPPTTTSHEDHHQQGTSSSSSSSSSSKPTSSSSSLSSSSGGDAKKHKKWVKEEY